MKHIFQRAKKLYKDAAIALEYSKANDTEEFRSGLRHYAVLCASILRRERIISLVTAPFVAAAYYGIVFPTFFALEATNSRDAVSFFCSIVASLLCIIIILRIFRGFKSRLVAFFLVSLGIFGSAMVAGHSAHRPWVYAPYVSSANLHDIIIDSFILFAVSIATFAVVVIGGGSVFFTLVITPMRKRNANFVIINTLVGVLKMIDKKTSKSDDLATKAGMCRALQFTADYLEEGVSRALSLPDPVARQILQEKLTSSAGYLHEMQLWVALAKDETQNNTRDAIAYYIELIARGEYDSLPSGTLTDTPQSKTSGLIRFGRMFIVAVIPFACLIGTRYAGLQLSSEFTGWSVVVALAWAAITLVSAIDPLYKTRLKDVQDLISTVRGKDGGLSAALSAVSDK